MNSPYIHQNYQSSFESLQAAAYATVGEAIVVANIKGKIVLINEHVVHIWGHEAEELIGSDLSMLIPHSLRKAHEAGMHRYLATGKQQVLGQRVELEALHQNGKTFPIQLFVSESTVVNERFFIAAIRDITQEVKLRKALEAAREELEAANAKVNAQNTLLKDKASHDALTQTLNHSTIRHVLKTHLEDTSGTELSMLFIDIDNFKMLNDMHGHIYGDQCLRQLIEVIKESAIRRTDILGRYGGEEFLIILPESAQATAMEVAERIRAKVADANWKYDKVSVTIGVATTTENMLVDAFIDQADMAMYYGKRHGKNQVVHYTEITT